MLWKAAFSTFDEVRHLLVLAAWGRRIAENVAQFHDSGKADAEEIFSPV